MMDFWKDKDGEGILYCQECLGLQVERTREGIFIGDERVTLDMFEFSGHHGQCDLCLEQCEDYPDCEGRN